MNDIPPPDKVPLTKEQLLNEPKDVPPKFYEHATLLVLFYNRWFRFAAIMFLLGLLSVAMLLPRIWRVTPAHMPIVRISGLDYIQSGSLRRSAMKQAEQGQSKEALLSWKSAFENNPGDPDLLRSMLRYANGLEDLPSDFSGYCANRSLWLLSLSRTNINDLALAVETLERLEEDHYVIDLSSRKVNELPPSAQGAVARAQFRLGAMDKFEEIWNLNPQELGKQLTTSLYRIAWQAGWGPPATVTEGRMKMLHELNSTNSLAASTAHHLQLFVSLAAQDLRSYEKNLEWLIEHHEDRVSEHINHWHLLIDLGRRADAISLAKGASRPPESAAEALGIAKLYRELDMQEVGLEFLEKQIKTYGYSPDLWVELAQARIALKRWDELFGQGITMRRSEFLNGSLDGFSYFVEGFSHVQTSHTEAAATAFKRASEGRFNHQAYLAFDCARKMRQLGYSGEAEELLRKVRGTFTRQAEYWFELSLAAYSAKDMDTMAMATEKAYQLDPDKTGYANNYAAVLIAQRTNPEEAIKLTNRLLAALPENPDLKVNHALALMQVQRYKEAANILKSINPLRLKSNEASVVNYAWAEWHLNNHDPASARKSYNQVNTNYLMPPQVVWMESKLKNL